MNAQRLPHEFRAMTQIALLGHIAPHVRLIVASVDAQKRCLIRMYLDRPGDESDREMINDVFDELAAALPPTVVSDYRHEIVETREPLKQLDNLHGALYERREPYIV